MLILIVAGGPDKGRLYELFDDKPVVIGRDGADLQFSDVKVSRRHARIWCEGGRWYLEDLNSRHGTHRNHKDIQDEWQPLKDGDYIQVGKTVMVLARMSAEHLEQVKADAGFRKAVAGRSSKFKFIAAGSAVAAAILIALNVAVLVNSNRGVERIHEQVAATTQQALDAERSEQAELRTMIAELGESSDAVVPKLDTVLAMIDAQPDVAGQLDALALAIADRRPTSRAGPRVRAANPLLMTSRGPTIVSRPTVTSQRA
ncbi:MAG: FHA domain-containing protein, partial [Planctomycetota bacterium]